MLDLLKGFLEGLREVLRWRTAVVVILFAAASATIWTVIGFLYWPQLLALSDFLLEWLPFAMARSNGAWMLTTFLWIQVILISVAIVSLVLTVTLYRSLPKKAFTGVAIWILLGTTAFWSVVWIFKGADIHSSILGLLSNLPFETVTNGVSALMIFYFLYNGAIITMVLFTSLYSPVLLQRVRAEICPEAEFHGEAELRSFGYSLRNSALFMVVTLIAVPLLFVPVINLILQLTLWMWLVKDTFTYNVGALFFSSEELHRLKKGNWHLWAVAGVTALFNFFPLLNFAGPFFGETMMFYYLVGRKNKKQ